MKFIKKFLKTISYILFFAGVILIGFVFITHKDLIIELLEKIVEAKAVQGLYMTLAGCGLIYLSALVLALASKIHVKKKAKEEEVDEDDQEIEVEPEEDSFNSY